MNEKKSNYEKKTKEQIPVAVKMEKQTYAQRMRNQTDSKKESKKKKKQKKTTKYVYALSSLNDEQKTQSNHSR